MKDPVNSEDCLLCKSSLEVFHMMHQLESWIVLELRLALVQLSINL